VWEPPHRFVDAQLSGPYRSGTTPIGSARTGDGATVLGDRVRYAIPFGLAGEAARSLFVERDLERIFDHRRDAVAALGGAPVLDAPRP